jgi:hypothetical protein
VSAVRHEFLMAVGILAALGFTNVDRERILRDRELKLRWRVEITLALTNELALSPVGKVIYVDQRIPEPIAVDESDARRSRP